MSDYQQSLSPPVFPHPWASDWGEDRYGLWQALRYKKVRYVFRWIEPGSFLMGSPKDEPERNDEGNIVWGAETQHQVHISRGFWLGETVVTQDLWSAVMGENPSYFTPEKTNTDIFNHPVEQVSWDDSKQFIKKLNVFLEEANKDFPLPQEQFGELALPSEAEWEFVCRAGTQTPFHFGENITTDQVNFDGNYPYNRAEKGEFREQTVPVKSFPCNDWGLHEMHGNVWEWCEDSYQRDLGSKAVTDPLSSDQASNRVLRGGSWSGFGRVVRSAFRNNYSPDYRHRSIGLRLFLGHRALQNL